MKASSSPVVAAPLTAAAAALLLGFQSPAAPPRRVGIPLSCSRGPSSQAHVVTITAPARVAHGSRYTVRVDGVDSGPIDHTGLHYIYDMRSTWPVPPGAAYVEGSARVLPGTGSANVRAGAHVVHAPDGVTLVLPSHVDDGASYTPPSFAFDLDAAAPEGAWIAQQFGGFSVMAHVFLLGDLRTACVPATRSAPVATTLVESAP